MKDERIIEVVRAHMEGKQIDMRQKVDPSGWWQMSPCHIWDFSTYDYRVKPEPRKPREWTVLVSTNEFFIESPRVYPFPVESKKEEQFYIKPIRVREVIE